VFSREIPAAAFPQRFRQPSTIVKYNGETDPCVWLNDYRLACQLGGATSDEVIIRNLLLHLDDSARTWLEHLPASQIHNWDDLVRTFVGNFQGTYVRPRNSWDLRSCTQKPGESLRDFIRRFSKRCTELPSMAQSEIVHAFLEGTTCRDLVRELGRSPPVDSNELFDIATSFASGEEAVGAIFDGKKGKRSDDAPAEGSKSSEPHRKDKRGKKGKKPRREAREQGRDGDDAEALAVDPARQGPRPAPRGLGVFDDMLKKPCPYHKTPVNHTLEQCDMLKKFYGRAAAKDAEAKKDGGQAHRQDGQVFCPRRWRAIQAHRLRHLAAVHPHSRRARAPAGHPRGNLRPSRRAPYPRWQRFPPRLLLAYRGRGCQRDRAHL
jgi:hypothetical protein